MLRVLILMCFSVVTQRFQEQFEVPEHFLKCTLLKLGDLFFNDRFALLQLYEAS